MSDSAIGKIVIIVLTLVAVAILILSDFGNSTTVKVYDCSMAEWHPDIPLEVRQECRRLRLEEQYRQNEQYFPKKSLTIT